MPDAPDPTSPIATPPPEDEAEEPEPEPEEEENAADDADAEEAPSEKSSPPPVQIIPRKKRLGRPPKNRPPDWDSPRVNDDGVQSENTTPMKRKRGRPPGGGGQRGRPRGSFYAPTRVAVDKEGTMMDVVNDEVDVPEDPDGETKVDKNGNLLGGREYRVRTFTVMNRQKRLYMLSTEPARCCGFRDSYLFFTKHPRLYKVIIGEDEKRDLIDRDVIPHSYKGRSIGVVTARSVFREFGARIVVGGKRITDDYNVVEAKARGDVEGELVDPHDRLPAEGEEYNRNQYVAWHGASAVYHTNLPSVPITNGKPLPKRRIQITSANWQFEHARAARYVFAPFTINDLLLTIRSRFNSNLVAKRREVWDGLYDPHTNVMHYPRITQPTHAKWEHVNNEASTDVERNPQRLLTNGTSHHQPPKTIFEPVPDVVSRNFLVVDTVYKAPSMNALGNPGADGNMLTLGPNGLPNVTDEILAEMPPDCRAALLEAKRHEKEWKETWTSETNDGMRGNLKIGFMGFPV
jgi:chromatin structure-remodeling complex protein RSC7